MTEDRIKSLLPEYLLRSEIFSVVVTDMEGKYVFVNDVFKKRFHFITQDWIGKESFIAIYPEDHATCLRAVEQCLAQPDKIVQVHLRKPDTSLDNFYWTAWEFSVLKDKNHNPIGILCLGQDITETERASLEAKAFAQKVETIIEEIADGFYQLDREWRFTVINKVAEQVLGIPKEQLLGRKIWDLFPDTPDYNYPAAYRRAMTENISVTFEEHHHNRWFSVIVYPSVEGISVFLRNITQEKQNQIALAEAQKQLQENFALLHSVFESPNDIIIFSLDKNYCYTSFTQFHRETMKKIWGVDIHLGLNMLEIITLPQDRAKAKQNFDRALQGESFSLIEEYGDDNLYRTFYQDYYYPVKNKEGEIIGLSVFVIDITQAKKAQMALEETEVKLRAILDSSTESNLLISPQGKILNFNKTANKHALKYFQKELYLGADIREFLTPDGIQTFEEYFPKALKGENHAIQVERRIQETSLWIAATYLPVYNKNEQIIGVTLVSKDITEEKQAQIKLQEKENMLRAIYQSTTEASTFIDKNLIIRYNNQVARSATKQIFGKEALPGDHSLDYILPEYKAEFATYYQKVLQGEHFFIEKTKNNHWWLFRLFPVYDEEKNIIGIASNVQDITEQKLKTIELEEKTQQLQSILEAIPHPLLIVSEDIKIQYVNEEFEKVFGYTEQEILGQGTDFLLPERFRKNHPFLQKEYLKKSGALIKSIGRFLAALTKTGEEIDISASLNTFTLKSKKHVIIILQDITELKKKQDTILKQNETLRKIAWEQSHQVRRPVANILGLCDLLQNYPQESEEMKKIYIDYLLQATRELDEIIHKIVEQTNETNFF